MISYLRSKLTQYWLAWRGYAINGGIKFPLEADFMSEKMRRRLRRGRYETGEASVAKAFLRDGDTVLELGGGIGFVSTDLRRYTKVKRIVTYEANPDLIPYIKRIHELNGVGEIEVRYGVVVASPTAASVRFYVRKDFYAGSLSANGPAVIRHVDVPTIAWADVMSEICPTALVIDIEGGEAELIGSCDLGSIQRIIIELHPALCSVPEMAAIYSSLESQNFRSRKDLAEGRVFAFERY